MVEVIPGLLLGSMGDVLALLGRRPPHRVTHLLSLLNKPIDWSELKTPQGNLMVKLVMAADLPTTDLLTHFPSCVQFLDDGLSEGTVLIHCEHGISRSSTVVIAYLMVKNKMSFHKALEFLKDKKPDVRPNLGFQEQLKLWELMKYKLDDTCKPYRAYVLHHQAQTMKKNGYMESMQLSPLPNQVKNGTFYKCRKCRQVLFTGESILQHELGAGESSFPKRQHGNSQNYFVLNDSKPCSKLKEDASRCKFTPGTEKQTEPQIREDDDTLLVNEMVELPVVEQACCLENETNDGSGRDFEIVKGKQNGNDPGSGSDSSDGPSTLETAKHLSVMKELAALRTEVSSLRMNHLPTDEACSSLFVEPVEWMGPLLLGHKDGKLLCPKCSSRIGSFDWAGTQCSCGRWVTPAFKMVKSKVDTVYLNNI